MTIPSFPQALMLSTALAAALACSGCGPSVSRGSDDPSIDKAAMSLKFDQRDINLIVGKMVDGLMGSAFLQEVTAEGKKPRIAIDDLVNETDQHLNTEEILNLIQGKIVNTRKMTFVDKGQREKIEQELGKQLRDVVNQGTASQLGKQLGIQYFMMGKIWSGSERLKDVKRTQYRVSLKVVNLETLAVEWQDDQSITKQMQ